MRQFQTPSPGATMFASCLATRHWDGFDPDVRLRVRPVLSSREWQVLRELARSSGGQVGADITTEPLSASTICSAAMLSNENGADFGPQVVWSPGPAHHSHS